MKNTKLFALSILMIIFVAFFYKFWDILMLFFSSALIAYLLNPLVHYTMKKTKVKRGIAVTIVALIFTLIIVSIISTTVPALVAQVGALISDINKWAPSFEATISDTLAWLDTLKLPASVTDNISGIMSQADVLIANFLKGLVSTILSFTTQIFDVVVFFILVIYFMLDGEMLMSGFYNKLPGRIKSRAIGIIKKTDEITWKYIRSKIVISFFMAIITYIGFVVLGLNYSLVFAVLAFILNFIPYFGSLIAGVVPVFYALIAFGLGKAIAVLVLIVVIQQIEGNIISPKVQGDLSGIHPVTVMFAILACNKIWGPVGMLIAVPLAAAFKMVINEIYDYIFS